MYKRAGAGGSSESNGNEATADKRNRGRKRLAKVAAVADSAFLGRKLLPEIGQENLLVSFMGMKDKFELGCEILYTTSLTDYCMRNDLWYLCRS